MGIPDMAWTKVSVIVLMGEWAGLDPSCPLKKYGEPAIEWSEALKSRFGNGCLGGGGTGTGGPVFIASWHACWH